ncbi:hypothetical protein [Janthinobacterium agaricidamnosum]|uniref:Uncharacterized protein n=1 Tax=Janthinobacterium agaricidamnosum NBRC 102515 = DSM 9628 TaxID=1349767 RepID=W0V4W9_9BURK|nr:hypothetical protein [Janthinobacterium agaricidamnosum]CDG82317.1 hypothetical protein GJA_1679 [Janthinobacterium agaricidamnosum NBRC 102515 = DSM 9628]
MLWIKRLCYVTRLSLIAVAGFKRRVPERLIAWKSAKARLEVHRGQTAFLRPPAIVEIVSRACGVVAKGDVARGMDFAIFLASDLFRERCVRLPA